MSSTRRPAGLLLVIVAVATLIGAPAPFVPVAERESPRELGVPGTPSMRPEAEATTSKALAPVPSERPKADAVPPSNGPSPGRAERRAERGADAGEQPKSPDGALQFRRLQQQDENGYVPPDGLLRAKQHVDQMRQLQEAARSLDERSAAGITSANWTWLGPGNIGGRVRSIVVNPAAPSTWFAGSVSGGIWKTVDSGAHWEPVNDFLANLSISSMVIQPGNPLVMYAGTGESVQELQGAGIFKSTDGGSTWEILDSTSTNPAFTYVNRLAISPNGTVLLAATVTGIYRSIDDGATFTVVLDTVWNPGFDRPMYVAFNPGDSSKAIASAFNSKAWYSNDGGLTWTASTGLPVVADGSHRVELAYAPSNPAVVYASVDRGGGTIYKSTNGGVSYSFVSTGMSYLMPQGWYNNAIWVDPTNPNRLVVGGVQLYRSTDGGLTLTQIQGMVHNDFHAISSMPGYNGSTNRQVLVGNDGGVYFIDDISAAPAGWVSKNNNLGITQFYGAAGNASSGTIVGGTQDNGTLRFTAAGGPQAYTSMAGADGGYAASDPTDPNYFYGEAQWLSVHRSSNGGASSTVFFGTAIPDYGGNSNFIAPFILDPNNSSTLLAGGRSLWRTTDAKFGNPPRFSSIKTPISGSVPISAIAVAPGNSGICWVGHNNGDVYKAIDCTSASPTWTQMDTNGPGLPNRMVMRLTIDPTDPTGNRVYAAFGGFRADNVWRTANGGGSWSSVSGAGNTALPAAPVHDLEVYPFGSNWLYAATEIGIFTSQDSGLTWKVPQDGPANVIVSELFWMASSPFGPVADLIAATFGRGLYRASAFGGPSGTLSSSALSFGAQMVGTTSAPQAVTLTNTGTESLHINPTMVVSPDFQIVEPTTCGEFAVPVGGSCIVTVRFSPTAVGDRTGTLSIQTLGGPFVINLAGTGVLAGPVGTLSSTSHSFGIQSLGTTSVEHTIFLRNVGTAPLLFTTAITGMFSQGFQLGSGTDCSIERPLPVGTSCPIAVKFSPNGSGIRTGTVILNSNAVNSPHVISLTGTGVSAADVFFSDDLESGAPGWSWQPTWSVTTESAHSGSHAWSNSPGGVYGPNLNSLIWSPVIDLTTATSPQLTFWQRREFASDGSDSGNVWVTTDGWTTYTFLASYTGMNLTWSKSTVDLAAYAGAPSLQVVFQVLSDTALTGDGWYIDDVVVANGAPSSFGKTLPSDGATGLAIVQGIGLGWQASTGATGYEYCYDTVNNNTCDTAWLDAGTFGTGVLGLTSGTTYFWQVRARNSVGTTEADNGAWWSFTTTSDVFPPTVIGVTPPNLATGVSPATAVTATFSEAIDDFTLFFGGFTLHNSTDVVPAGVVYDSNTFVATLTPSAPLATATTYTATVSTVVKDMVGNRLLSPVVWSFTTASPPVNVGLTTVGALLDTGDSNYLNGSKVTTAAAGQVSSMSVYVGPIDSVVANRQFQLAIYRDSAGRPGTLVAASATATLSANAWNTLPVSASLLGNTTYWLMFNTNGRTGAVNNMRYNTGAAGQGAYSTAAVPFETWPPTFPAATLTNFAFSLFATLGTDTTPPTVIFVTPANGATGISTVTDMMAAFSEPIDPATLTTSSFVLRDPAGVSVGAAVGYGEATRVATLTPSAPLAGLTTYTATISTAVKDVAGNALALPVVWSFTTAADPPSAFGKSSPSNGSVGSIIKPYLGLTWLGSTGATSYEYCIDTVDNSLCDTSWFTSTQGLGAGVSGLTAGATYFWQARARNAGGTTEANGGTWWNVTTNTDVTPPTVTSVFPTNGATGVSPSTVVTATISEAVDDFAAGFGGLTLHQGTNEVLGKGGYDRATFVVTLTPAAPLAASTTYTVTATTRVIDLAGNPLQSPVVWSFTTAGAADTTPPTVSSVTPLSGATGVSPSTTVTATFSEPMSAATVTNATFVLLNPAHSPIGATVSYDAAARVARLTPLVALSASTTYTARLWGAGSCPCITDVAGNGLAGDFSWSFTTATTSTPVTVGVTTIGSSVDSGDSNYLNGSKVTTAAAGQVSSMSVYVGAIDSVVANRQYQLALYRDNAGRPGTLVAASAPGTLVANAWNTLPVSVSLVGSTNYWLMYNTNGRTAAVNNMRYNPGPAGQGAYSTASVAFGTWPAAFPAATLTNFAFSLFATLGSDTTPPTVVDMTPSNGTTGVSTTPIVTATFSEAINPTTLTTSTFVLIDPANNWVTTTVSYNATTRVATLTPSSALAGSTTYTVRLWGQERGACPCVQDVAGNPLASDVFWSFTTVGGDTTAPTVIANTPLNGATGVSPSTTVTATFSEPMNAATVTSGTFVLRNPANGPIGVTVIYDAAARIATLTPSATLAGSTTYTATLWGADRGACPPCVRDLAGNPLTSDVFWSFTTAAVSTPVTVGLTTIGSSVDSGDSNYLNGSKVTTTASGQIASMSVYVAAIDSLAANRQYQLAIYRDNAGRPGTLVAASATGTLVANAWNTLPINATLLAGTNYWLMFNTNGRTGAVNNMRHNTGAAGQGAYSTASVPFGTWPAAFPAATTTNFVFSLYATFGP